MTTSGVGKSQRVSTRQTSKAPKPATTTSPPHSTASRVVADKTAVVEQRRGQDGFAGHHHFQRYVPAQSSPVAQHGEELKATSLLDLRARAEDDSFDVIFQKHMVDFRTAFAEIRHQAPSVVVFGGARLKPGDPYYTLSEKLGASLADWGIPPKTGAGPGAMHAVPAGFIAVRDEREIRVVQTVVAGVSRLADLDSQRTLGFNIKLPAEQKLSPSIEESAEIQQFAFRKFALYENARGVVVMPGGFGTIDELMEVLVLKGAGRTQDPVVLLGKDYWQPIVDAMKGAALRNGADLVAGLFDDVLITDDAEAATDFIGRHDGVKAFDEDPDELYVNMTRELKLARYVVTNQEKAVTVLGGDRLSANDSALGVLGELAALVSDAGLPLRVGHDGPVRTIVEKNADNVQKVLWDASGPTPQTSSRKKPSKKPDVNNVSFSERIPHKEALLRNSSAYVVLPCADRGKDEFTTVLCQIQTGKLPPRPIVLVDSAYWKPIVDAWAQQMIGDNHAYIEPVDLELVTFADSADAVMKALG